MCGTAGYLEREVSGLDRNEVLIRVAGVIHPRGPNDGEIWFDAITSVGLVRDVLMVEAWLGEQSASLDVDAVLTGATAGRPNEGFDVTHG
jgi:asparagine synthetase B (glutamine-hydrolysing)